MARPSDQHDDLDEQKIFTSSQKPRRMSGNESFSELHEKNVSLTVGQPLLVTMAVTSAPEDDHGGDAWRSSGRAGAPALRRLARGAPVDGDRRGAQLQLGGRGAAHPLVLQALELAAGAQLGQRLVDARRELGALLQQQPPLVAAGRLELPDDLRVGDLGRGQVIGRRQVDDDRVDALDLQRPHRVVGVVEGLRRLRRLDRRVDRVVAGGAELHAELGLRPGRRGSSRRRRAIPWWPRRPAAP